MKKAIFYLCSILLLLSVTSLKSQTVANAITTDYANNGNYFFMSDLNYESGSYAHFQKHSDAHKKKFFFTAAFDPNFTHTTPPIYTYFEIGIANVASAGASIGASYDNIDMGTYNIETGYLAVGPRFNAYPLAIISKIMGEQINAAGFEPHVGIVYDFVVMKRQVDDQDDQTFTDGQLGACFGTRWYPGDKRRFALFAEYNTNGIGNSLFKVDYTHLQGTPGGFRVGITLGR